MSTKIYNGYVIKGVETLEHVQSLMREFRRKVMRKVHELVAKKKAEVMTDILDHRALGMKYTDTEEGDLQKDDSPVFFAFKVINGRWNKIRRTMQRDPEFDFQCEVCVIASGGKTLAILYTEQEELTKIWQKMPGVKEYGYWNNTDRPDNVSSKEWDQRRKDWDKAFGDSSTPSEVGLSFTCISDYSLPLPKVADCMKYIPSWEDRSRAYAHDKAISFKMRKLARASGDRKKFSFDMYFEAERYVKRTDEGQALRDRYMAKVKAKLPKTYVEKDFSGD